MQWNAVEAAFSLETDTHANFWVVVFNVIIIICL